ncbi:MAG TPA: hypothetical protein VF721_23520 [Pyrinomonadaceae bacterium]|jgi:hypothetical protein
MIRGKRKSNKATQTEEIEKLREKIQNLKPQTELGKTLSQLSRKGLESGVSVLDAEEIMSELGRSRYE